MAAHRKPRQRPLTGPAARTAATLTLAGAASATAFQGVGQAAPRLTPAQVKAQVDKLYQEAETATEKYDGAKEKTAASEKSLRSLRDQAARRTEQLNTARSALGSTASAQYRAGAIDPSLQVFLSSDPAQYLDRAAYVERVGDQQAAEVTGVRRQIGQLAQLHSEADSTLSRLRTQQAGLKKQKTTVQSKIRAAEALLSRLSASERSQYESQGGSRSGAQSGSLGADRSAAAQAADRSAVRGPVAAPGSRAARAVAFAYSALGKPYVWGATGPSSFDCSGLTQAAYRSAGVSLPRTTYTQINSGQRVSRSELAPGDLVFFYSGISHVGIYVGNGRMIHAPHPGAPVRLAPIGQMPFAGATRPVAGT
ncbi:NlpC/P60 family protein [Streptomyces sp. NBC_01089]|uniref:C40 family peptidase n=1 Tax=Streptomyces sp. NBC_01089 TaxID=2903747 RepID=UPI00386B955F|nr:NlpC/P60 family protein [Streptomyces sp. NBC_01089]